MTVLKYKEAGVWKMLPLSVNATVPIEAWHQVGAAGEPAFNTASGWQNLDAARLVGFRKDPLGKVRLTGACKGTAGTPIFTLPAGYLPVAESNFTTTAGNAYANIAVLANGQVIPNIGATSASVFLDGIEFDTRTVTAMPTGPQGPTGLSGVARTWQGVHGGLLTTTATSYVEMNSLLRVALAPVTTRWYTLRLVGQWEGSFGAAQVLAVQFWDVAAAATLPRTSHVARARAASENVSFVFEQTISGSLFAAGTRTISPYYMTSAGTLSIRGDIIVTSFTITETEAGT